MPADNHKVFVTSNFMVNFSCPKCNKFRRQDVSKIMGHETKVTIKCKCSCQHRFSITLERRRSIRKGKTFKGYIVEEHTKGYETQKLRKCKISVQDISRQGVKIKLLEKLSLKEEDKIKIEFELDDAKRSKILRVVRIKKMISPVEIGCEFISEDHYDHLGKYFLYNF